MCIHLNLVIAKQLQTASSHFHDIAILEAQWW